jgi:uncharacterized protein YajQ (UPF0234 family)
MQTETTPHQPVNHVFVDFENVKSIDASVIGGKHLRLHVFLGPQNKKLDVEVVEKLLENAQAVQLIRIATVGRNALDFVLAYHLGQAVLADPKGYFHIVSKDAGFDALVDLLKSRHVKVKRHVDWSTMHFQSTQKPAAAVVVPAAAAKPALSEAAQKLLENLRKNLKGRPKKEKTLIAHAMNYTGKDKPDAAAGAEKVVGELKKAKLIAVDEKGAVTYQL